MIVVSNRKIRHYWKCYLLAAVPLAFVLTFSYFPIVNGFIHIFYRWDGDRVREFVGLGNLVKVMHDAALWKSFGVVIIFMLANLVKMIPPIIAAVLLHHVVSARVQYFYRICFVVPMIVPAIVFLLIWKYFYEPNMGAINQLLRFVGVLGPTEAIRWLTDRHLVLPSLIFTGFPWVSAFGVLIYLAGLQSIGTEIYEAADLDGASPLRVFWHIEMPLITTQIRINLVLTMISTLQDWQFVYLFLGESGGPGGIATVPGLVIFREAFSRGYFGYGCAIGFMLFLLTLILAWINNRFVRVDK